MTTKQKRVPIGHAGELTGQYRNIRGAIQRTSADEIDHQLPNLVETIRDVSQDDDTVRFRVGISFTEMFTPLDYYLHRVVDADPGRTDEVLKDRASDRHMYLEFQYPADPRFDKYALRGAMLSAADRKLQSAKHRRQVEQNEVSGLWKQLSAFLD